MPLDQVSFCGSSLRLVSEDQSQWWDTYNRRW